MPVESHNRWVQDHFLSASEVRALAPAVRIRHQTVVVTSARFKEGMGMLFNKESGCVYLHEHGQLVDILDFPDMAAVRVGRHRFTCDFCEVNGHQECYSSVRAMYLDHCIEPMLEVVRKGKYLR